MPQPTNYTPPYSSNPSEEEDELREDLEQYCGVEDFWWDEEDRHELF